MPLSLIDRLRISFKDPTLWMIRGVMLLAGFLETPWMFVLIPLSEVIFQMWFPQLFRAQLGEADARATKEQKSLQLKQLSKADNQRYRQLTDCIAQIKQRLAGSSYAGQVDLDQLADNYGDRLLTLRRVEAVADGMREEALAAEIARQEKTLEAETNSKVRAAIAERLDLQKQRMGLKEKLGARARELEAQLRLVEEQVLLLRDTVLSTGVSKDGGLALDSGTSESGVSENIAVLSRQLRVCSELEEEMQSMLRSPSERNVAGG